MKPYYDLKNKKNTFLEKDIPITPRITNQKKYL